MIALTLLYNVYLPATIVFIIDHGIHPPIHKAWEAPDVPDTAHVLKNKRGVYNVYLNEEDMKNNKPCNYEYPDVVTFTTDFYNMCNMIADGPL